MTQGVIETKDSAVKVGVYDAKPAIARDTNIDTKPTDLIRWGPILSGLFAALASILGGYAGSRPRESRNAHAA
jgi:hypothetical protein